MQRLFVAAKAARQLGLRQVFAYARYQTGLRSGWYRRRTPMGIPQPVTPIRSPFLLPAREQLLAVWQSQPGAIRRDPAAELLAEADEIAAGNFRQFGAESVPINLQPPDANNHWSFYEGKSASWGVQDLKYAWEPARFGWVYPLGRAYLLTGDEKYPATFWRSFETFQQENPPNRGINWLSAQEVALRLLALLFALAAFENSAETTPDRGEQLSAAVAQHASRIPPTLAYAQAQNNNHLISEALGLCAAAWALPQHPDSPHWRQIGWRWLNRALQEQIAPDGVYTQHSMNYHRLMLQAALQAQLLGRAFPPETLERLAAATRWLLAQVDPQTGRAPNLGANDGAHILPIAPGGFHDYRPVAQAAARAFLKQPAFTSGPWDELSLWLGLDLLTGAPLSPFPASPAVPRMGTPANWTSLRCVRYHGRPSHADQLHVEVWWQGENLALDAGTFRYTASPPWDNALAGTLVHNTVTLNHTDQMRRAGRFLWLDWAQAERIPVENGESIAARHDGYTRLGAIHQRVIAHTGSGRWRVTDDLLPAGSAPKETARDPINFHLHWLLPDWPWHLTGSTLTLVRPRGGQVQLRLDLAGQTGKNAPGLIRAGQLLAGDEYPSPILGWYAPTYGQKLPALSFFLRGTAKLPFTLVSEWWLEAATSSQG